MAGEPEAPTTMVGTDASGNTQVYVVVTHAKGNQVTQAYTAPSGGNKATTTAVNDDIPTPDNPGWGDWEDGSKTPFELKAGYDSYLLGWVNEGIGAVTGRGRSNHMRSPKSTLADWAWDAVRSYANTGTMSWTMWKKTRSTSKWYIKMEGQYQSIG